MKAIVCVDKNWGIGKNGKLLAHNKLDMHFFKSATLNKTVVMGRKTLESFKDCKPLPNRINIVLSREDMYRTDIVQFMNIENFIESPYNNEDTIVIGGGQIYSLLLDYVDYIYVTKMENEFDADTFFPNLDKMENFEIVKESDLIKYNDISFRFLEYKRK